MFNPCVDVVLKSDLLIGSRDQIIVRIELLLKRNMLSILLREVLILSFGSNKESDYYYYWNQNKVKNAKTNYIYLYVIGDLGSEDIIIILVFNLKSIYCIILIIKSIVKIKSNF